MKDLIPAQFFSFGKMDSADWMTPDEILGLENLIMRAECHGGEHDLFLLCLKERTVLFQLKKEGGDSLQALGLVFPARDRHYWYYIPGLISMLLQMLETKDYMDYFRAHTQRELKFQTAKLTEAETWLKSRYPELMKAIAAFQEDTKYSLYPHSVAFTRLEKQLYCTEGIEFYRYYNTQASDGGIQKVVETSAKKSKQPSLYLKPPRILHTWMISDRHEKVKLGELETVQEWGTLYDRILHTWGDITDDCEK